MWLSYKSLKQWRADTQRKAVLVFIDGTICDDRHRLYLYDTEEFNNVEHVLKDTAVPGSVECLKELSEYYEIIYIGARSEDRKELTVKWLINNGFPCGEVYLAEEQKERLAIAGELSKTYNIAAGIGDRWDDNELHLHLGCLSIILEEYAGNWDTVRKYLLRSGIGM